MLTANVLRTTAAACALCAAAACNGPVLETCGKYAGSYPFHYTGEAAGRGLLELSPLDEREDVLHSKFTLWDDSGTDAVIHLEGPGSCEQGILRVRFGGGDHPDSGIKVLGGTFVGVPSPELFEELFGAWDVRVILKDSNEERRLRGYLREDLEAPESAQDSGSP